MNVKIIVPIYNPDAKFNMLIESYKGQTIYNNTEMLIINSGDSSDFIRSLDSKRFSIINISPDEFDHGKTRQLGVDCSIGADIVVFLTQDAILETKYSLEKLISTFRNPNIGAVYGRQIPHLCATSIAQHSRFFNYGKKSHVRTFDERREFGIKTTFLSNSFAAYKKEALISVGGFPNNMIFGEDMFIGAKLLMAGWKIGYSAEARVYHSHNYSIMDELKRSFDIGVFHERERWILNFFGKAEGEGIKFVKSEILFLCKNDLKKVPECILRDIVKFLGYKLGVRYKWLPNFIRKKISLNKKFWN